MQGDKKVIDYLNKALKNELTAINQYFLHARMFKNWGFEKLNEHEYNESIDEMKHSDCLIERILFLEGIPNVQKLGSVSIGEKIPEMLKADLDLELIAIPNLKKAIEVAREKQDYTSEEILERILESEEEHVDWLEAQLQIITDVGIENYLSLQV